MVINISVQYNGGFLPDIILLTQGYYHWGTRLNTSLSMEMSRLTRNGTAEPVSRDQIFRHARGQGNIYFPCSADHEQDWQPYPVDPYSTICDDHTYIHTYICSGFEFIAHAIVYYYYHV